MTLQSNSSPAKSKLSAALDLLLDIATALGTLREQARITEARVTSMEMRVDSLILSLRQSTPTTFSQNPPPPSTATGTPTDTPSIVKRTVSKLGREAIKDAAIWVAGKAGAMALPYITPALLALWAYSSSILRGAAMLWRALAG